MTPLLRIRIRVAVEILSGARARLVGSRWEAVGFLAWTPEGQQTLLLASEKTRKFSCLTLHESSWGSVHGISETGRIFQIVAMGRQIAMLAVKFNPRPWPPRATGGSCPRAGE